MEFDDLTHDWEQIARLQKKALKQRMRTKKLSNYPATDPTLSKSQQQGMLAQERAKEFLEKQGLVTIAENIRLDHDEIDLIMRTVNNIIVFVEVRSRTNQYYGTAIESIAKSKQKKWARAAQKYVHRYKIRTACRFDVIGVHKDHIEWIPNVQLF